MSVLKKIKPAFWDHRDVASSTGQAGLNFRKKWILLVVFTSFMALSPLLVMSIVELSLTRQIVETEVKNSMQQILECASSTLSQGNVSEKSLIEYAAKLNHEKGRDLFIADTRGKIISHVPLSEAGWKIQEIDPSVFWDRSGIFELESGNEKILLAAYAKVSDVPFFLVMTRSKDGLNDLWLTPRLKLVGYLGFSIILILISIMGTSTFLVNRIHSSDKKRTQAIHHAEHANKIASIGRLASGVAHEINNPLAIISQKTGLMLDLLAMKEKSPEDDRLIPLANDTLDAVTRCGTITKRLLDFARHMEPSIEKVSLENVVSQMLAFLKKEAEHRNIVFSVDNKTSIENFYCDKGSLQQIFLNLFENAFAAMENGGILEITLESKDKKHIQAVVSDTGRGIAKDDLNKIFEPFYSSKNEHWGTGLGLSITYGLVKELGGDIKVKSKLGQGTQFVLSFPLDTFSEPSEKSPTGSAEQDDALPMGAENR